MGRSVKKGPFVDAYLIKKVDAMHSLDRKSVV